MKKLCLSIVSLAALCSLSTSAQEGGVHPYMSTKHMLGVGLAYQDADSEFRATAGDLPPVSLDLSDLGVDNTDYSWALEYRWRFKPKWMLVALAYNFEQDGRRSIQRDFNFDGKEFQAGASVDTEVGIDTYIVDVLYSVYRSDRAEILLGGGIHAVDLEASIKGRANIGDLEREGARASSELLAPLPNFRAQAFYSLNENFGLGIAVGWLSADYDDYDGSFVYAHPRLGYSFNDRWAITVGYQFVDLDITYEKASNRELEFNVDFTGPTAFLNYRF